MERDEFSDNLEDVLDVLRVLEAVAGEHYWPNCRQNLADACRSIIAAQDIANAYGVEEEGRKE